MKSFAIKENYFEITKVNKQILRLDYAEIKSIKILYYHTFLQKILNLLTKVNKKNYKLSIHQNNDVHLVFNISQEEKELLKPRLDKLRINISKAKKANVNVKDEMSSSMFVA